jgi:hypothetical protein
VVGLLLPFRFTFYDVKSVCFNTREFNLYILSPAWGAVEKSPLLLRPLQAYYTIHA